MRPPFRERLGSTPVVFEVVPPGRRVGEKTLASLVRRVRDAVRAMPHIDAVNVPEVLDENHAGEPFYRNMDPRAFVEHLGPDLGVDPIVNKVVAHVPSLASLRKWIRESTGQGLRNFVLVGGTNSRIRYPGPSVVEANREFRAATRRRRDATLGNITIPERDDEVERLVAKTRAGADFFTTQVLFEAEPMATVLRAYGKRCASEGLLPATVLLSFAPVSDYGDIEFLVWLGATITPATEEALLTADGRPPGRASIDVARALWSHLQAAARLSRPPVPLGVNIEEVSVHNLDLAIEMAREFPSWTGQTRARSSDV
jgi:5,10-methylenetetrahydrofolate reductase